MRCLPHLFLSDFRLDEVLARERHEPSNATRFWPTANLGQLKLFGERSQAAGQAFTLKGLAQMAYEHRTPINEIMRDNARKMIEAVGKARADPDYVRKARDAPLDDSRARTSLILGELLRGFILDSNASMSENDAVDLIHAAMPLNCCDYVLLDGPWAEGVAKMNLRLTKSPMVMPIAQCFSRRNDGINAFLTHLETFRSHGHRLHAASVTERKVTKPELDKAAPASYALRRANCATLISSPSFSMRQCTTRSIDSTWWLQARCSPLTNRRDRERMLCEFCETKLSKWETYARALLTGGALLQYRREGDITWVEGIDYPLFKLFQLSILWRAGVATRGFFRKVTLGPHAERPRAMLLAEDPGEPWEYGCVTIGIHRQGTMVPVIVQPTPVRIMDAKGVRFTFGGYFWAYRIASHRPIQPGFIEAVLQRSGRLAVKFEPLETAGFYQDFLRNHNSKS